MNRFKDQTPSSIHAGSFLCGVLTLGLASVIGILLILVAALVLPVHIIEIVMVWLSVPWFLFWHFVCHGWNHPIFKPEGPTMRLVQKSHNVFNRP